MSQNQIENHLRAIESQPRVPFSFDNAVAFHAVFTVAALLINTTSVSPLRLPQVAVPFRALGERVVVVGGELCASLQRLRGHDGGYRAEPGVVEGAEMAVGSERVVHLVAQGGWNTMACHNVMSRYYSRDVQAGAKKNYPCLNFLP